MKNVSFVFVGRIRWWKLLLGDFGGWGLGVIGLGFCDFFVWFYYIFMEEGIL